MQTEKFQSPNDNQQIYPTFNPLTHIPPSYDIYGHQIPPNPNQSKYNILAEKDNIKVPWENNPLYKSTPMTRTKLLERRKKERIPDISYDLDGDGFVGGRDYVLSKRYDVDGDGKLNEIERKNALEGIQNGVEKELRANRIYPKGGEMYFSGEGEGITYRATYNWQSSVWHSFVIHAWDDRETGKTFLGLWIQNLKTEEWTLFAYFDCKAPSTKKS